MALQKPKVYNHKKIGQPITNGSPGGNNSSIPIWRLIAGNPIFPSGVEGVRKSVDVDIETIGSIALIPDLAAPILPPQVGVAINLTDFDRTNAPRRLVWLGNEAPLIHDLWLGMNFIAFSSVQILVTKAAPEDPDEFQSFLLPAWVS